MSDNLIYSFFTRGREAIPYYKEIGKVVGNTNAAILLQQLHYHFSLRQGKPFYKFKEPCKHKFYRPEDSWCEELGWTDGTFDRAKDRIATRVYSRAERERLLKKTDLQYCFLYFVDRDFNNLTWWYINENALNKVLREADAIAVARLARKKCTENIEEPLRGSVNLNVSVPLGPEINTKENINYEKVYEAKEQEVKPKQVGTKKPDKQIDWTKGTKLTIDFEIPDVIIDKTLERGFTREDFNDQFLSFRAYYSIGKGKSTKSPDWTTFFTDIWLQRAFEFGKIRRHGKFKDGTNANRSRAEILREQLDPNLFADVGAPRPRSF